MSQVYVLELAYLVCGGMLLLSDSHGIRYPLLLSLRYAFRTQRRVRLLLIWGGVALALLSVFVPYDPGPVLLGDLSVTATIIPLVVWYIALARKVGSGKRCPAVVEDVAGYVERHKMRAGKLVLLVACVHFLVPMVVLV